MHIALIALYILLLHIPVCRFVIVVHRKKSRPMICDFTQQHFHTRPLSLMFMDKLQDGRGNPLIYSASDSVHPISSYPPSLHPPNPIQPYSTSSWHVGQRRWSPFCFCGEEEPPLTLSTYLYFHNTFRPSAGRDSLICPLTLPNSNLKSSSNVANLSFLVVR